MLAEHVMPTDDPLIFRQLGARPWFRAVLELTQALANDDADPRVLTRAYRSLYRSVLDSGAADLPEAIAEALLHDESQLARLAMARDDVPHAVAAGARADLYSLSEIAVRDWAACVGRRLGEDALPIAGFRQDKVKGEVAEVARSLATGDIQRVYRLLLDKYARDGAGPLARHDAFRWDGRLLSGIEHPDLPDLDVLSGLSEQIARLVCNTERFVRRLPAHHVLLYGPRGSGKSTAVRGLGNRFAGSGLRLIELPPALLKDLPTVVEQLRDRPHRYLLFVDDLTFERDDGSHSPLKTLLEGSLTRAPRNVAVYATSNRRHLVRERFGDRPDPLHDEVHAWDSHHERLALADRFGLTITFPDANQRRYLEIVTHLMEREGLEVDGLHERALAFARWNSGYSGRTAKQFVETCKAESSQWR